MVANPEILTIGYGNRGYQNFLETLRSFNITHIVDVRSVPQSSYWKDFGREALEASIPWAQMRYVYMGDTLGAQQPTDGNTKPVEGRHPNFAHPNLRKGIRALLSAAGDSSKKICLMCGCLRPHACHRSSLVGEVLVDEGVSVMHILADDSLASQESVMLEAANFQSSLF